ncbi:MAG: D-alanyl-D-alanine carboxypeptidase [Arcanobacterium sp.]|nr:D-alanyl-D-alanine carboxypeptidase [Arcanobacterium sp.]
MKKIRIGLSAVLVFAGTYVMADAWDIVPGLITMKPIENQAQPYPVPDPAELPAAPVFLADDAAPMPSAQKVSAVLQSLAGTPELSGTKLRALVIDAVTGTELVNVEANQATIPASVQKLLTTSAFLEAYGPAHRFSTKVMYDDDALYLVGGGDILLTADSQKLSAETKTSLRARGYGVPSSLSDLTSQTVTALNSKLPQSSSADSVGSPEKLYLDISLFTGPEFHESVAGDGVLDWIMPLTPIAINKGLGADNKFISHPAEAAAQEFVKQLASQGLNIEYAGVAQTSEAAKEIAKIDSLSVQEISNRILGDSDNSLAEVAAHLTAIKLGYPADFTGASTAISAQLKKFGISLDNFKVVDGSGFSEENRVTAAGIVKLLKHFWDCGDCFGTRITDGLPIAGLDGTLSGRYRTETGVASIGAGEIRAKTGTLLSANSLAGYLRTNAGRPLIFAILVEGNAPGGAKEVRSAIDTAMEKILTLGGTKS